MRYFSKLYCIFQLLLMSLRLFWAITSSKLKEVIISHATTAICHPIKQHKNTYYLNIIIKMTEFECWIYFLKSFTLRAWDLFLKHCCFGHVFGRKLLFVLIYCSILRMQATIKIERYIHLRFKFQNNSSLCFDSEIVKPWVFQLQFRFLW